MLAPIDILRAIAVGAAVLALALVWIIWIGASVEFGNNFKALRKRTRDDVAFYVFVLSLRIIICVGIVALLGGLCFYGLYAVGSKLLGYN